jgi:hypothetical protein
MLGGMSIPHFPPPPAQATIFQVKVKGHLAPVWAGWFERMAISQMEDGDTRLPGAAIDQAALHDILKKVRGPGLTLLAVTHLESLPHADTDDKELNA